MIVRAGVLALALAACESDANKLDRLQEAASIDRLDLLVAENPLKNIATTYPDPEVRQRMLPEAEGNIDEARDRLILAQRDLDAFLHP